MWKVRFWLKSVVWVNLRTSQMRGWNASLWSITRYVLAYCFSYFWRFFSCRPNWSRGAQILFRYGGHENLHFRMVFYFRFLSGFYFLSDFYTRDSGGTTATPHLWPLGPWKWSVPSDWRHRNGSPRASDQTHGSPARKLTCLAGCYDLAYLLERFPWFSQTFLQLRNRLKVAISMTTIPGWNSNLLSNLGLLRNS